MAPPSCGCRCGRSGSPARLRGDLRTVRHRAADLPASRRLLHQEPRVRHQPRPRRTGLRAQGRRCEKASSGRWSGTAKPAGYSATSPALFHLPSTIYHFMTNIPRAQDQLFDTRQSARQKYAALVVGRPGWGALLKHEAITLLAQNVPGALGFALRKTFYPSLLGACGRNVVFGQNVVLRHPGQDSHRRQRRRRRQLPARCERRHQSRHHDRQRRLHRPQHDPVVQERRHHDRGRREHRFQLRAVLGEPGAGRRRNAAGGVLLPDWRRPRLQRSRRVGAGPGPALGRHRRRQRRVARRRRQDPGRRDHRQRSPSSAPAPSSAIPSLMARLRWASPRACGRSSRTGKSAAGSVES